MSSAETQSGAKGNFRVEILLHSWQPTFTRFLQRARLMAQESIVAGVSFTKRITSSTDTFGLERKRGPRLANVQIPVSLSERYLRFATRLPRNRISCRARPR